MIDLRSYAKFADADGDTAGSSPNSFAQTYCSSVPLEMPTRRDWEEGWRTRRGVLLSNVYSRRFGILVAQTSVCACTG